MTPLRERFLAELRRQPGLRSVEARVLLAFDAALDPTPVPEAERQLADMRSALEQVEKCEVACRTCRAVAKTAREDSRG